jgi:hypothetical protein
MLTWRRGGKYEPRSEALSYKNWKWRPHNCAESFRLWDLRYSNYSGRRRSREKAFQIIYWWLRCKRHSEVLVRMTDMEMTLSFSFRLCFKLGTCALDKTWLSFSKTAENMSIYSHSRLTVRYGHYSGRTAPLTSRRCILNIYSTNIRTEYFKHVT